MKIFQLSRSQIETCPTRTLNASHWREDGTCRCCEYRGPNERCRAQDWGTVQPVGEGLFEAQKGVVEGSADYCRRHAVGIARAINHERHRELHGLHGFGLHPNPVAGCPDCYPPGPTGLHRP